MGLPSKHLHKKTMAPSKKDTRENEKDIEFPRSEDFESPYVDKEDAVTNCYLKIRRIAFDPDLDSELKKQVKDKAMKRGAA